MKISTKGRYAMRLMLELALAEPKTPVSIKDIANKQNISDKYLEQIISVLNKAGFVRSIRGAQGGYVLTKKPSEYTVGMILRLTEGSLAPVACLDQDIDCDRIDECATIFLWRKINDAVSDVVDKTTLEDVVNWQRSLKSEE